MLNKHENVGDGASYKRTGWEDLDACNANSSEQLGDILDGAGTCLEHLLLLTAVGSPALPKVWRFERRWPVAQQSQSQL